MLFKDVDGYYDCDPNQSGSDARRFDTLSWETALKIGGGVVQEKSIYFSRVRRLPFVVRAPGFPVRHGLDLSRITWPTQTLDA